MQRLISMYKMRGIKYDQYCYLPDVINGVMEREGQFLLVCSNYCYKSLFQISIHLMRYEINTSRLKRELFSCLLILAVTASNKHMRLRFIHLCGNTSTCAMSITGFFAKTINFNLENNYKYI